MGTGNLSLAQSIIRNALGLGLFAVVTAGLIAVTQHLTADAIQTQRERAQAGALLEIIPADRHDNELLKDTFIVPPNELLALTSPGLGYRARRNGEVIGVILPAVAPEGYSGPIRLIVGVARDGDVLGVRVLEHRETPGLGDQIEARKSDWIEGFRGTSLGSPPADQWAVQKHGGNFDQFTGATITPQAVVMAIKNALAYFQANRSTLLADGTQVNAGRLTEAGPAATADQETDTNVR